MSIYDEMRRTILKKRGTDIRSFLTGTQAREEGAMGRLESRRLGRSGAAMRVGRRVQEAEKYGAHQITSASDVELKRLELLEEQEKRRKQITLGKVIGGLVGMIGTPLAWKLLGPKAEPSFLEQFFAGQSTAGSSAGLPSYQRPQFGGALDFRKYLQGGESGY